MDTPKRVLHYRIVYYGSRISSWETRSFSELLSILERINQLQNHGDVVVTTNEIIS